MKNSRLQDGSIKTSLWLSSLLVWFLLCLYLLLEQPYTWAPQIAGILIAAGIPASYYLYMEWVKQPYVVVVNDEFKINHVIAPNWYTRNYLLNQQNRDKKSFYQKVPFNAAQPMIFSKITLENRGEATATDCLIRIKAKLSHKEEPLDFNARWARPDNPDRFNLLPGEKRDAHIYKSYLTHDHYFFAGKLRPQKEHLKHLSKDEFSQIERKVEDIEINDTSINGLYKISKKIDSSKTSEMEPTVVHPRPQRPEKKETSTWGGWEEKEIEKDKNMNIDFEWIKVQIISEEKKMNERTLTGFLNLKELLCKGGEDNQKEISWQGQWQDSKKETGKLKEKLQVIFKSYCIDNQ